MKLPAIQFYPGDWRKDPGVQSLSFHDRGVWFEILLLMHESAQRGKLLLNGKKMPDDSLARLLGLDKQSLTNVLTSLLSSGVASVCEQTGALMSRRMVRDEEIRKKRQIIGKLGGNPKLLLNQKSNQIPEDEDEDKDVASVKRRLNKLFNRPESHIWPYFEESSLVDLMKRPAFAEEFEELEKFKSKPDSFFPRSNEALMRDWSKTLDRARNHGDKKHNSKGGNF